MMKMKHNKEFQIKIEAGTNAEITKEEFLKEILKTLTFVESVINQITNIRFHLSVKDDDLRIVNKWTPEETDKLIEKIKNLGNKN